MAVAALKIVESEPIDLPVVELDPTVTDCIARAAQGDCDALFDLGVIYSTGANGVQVDMIEAHKWFNLAALGGSEEGKGCRADISDEMTAREIADAQKEARAWLSEISRRAA